MSSANKNLSTYSKMPNASKMRFGIVVSEWNPEITEALFKGAYETLISAGCPENNIVRQNVPGSFELPLGAAFLLDSIKPDVVICLGCVIQGETRHFDFICDAVSNGIMRLNLDYKVPVVFGVLTTENMHQAVERSGGKHGNKGIEAGVTAVEMAAMFKKEI